MLRDQRQEDCRDWLARLDHLASVNSISRDPVLKEKDRTGVITPKIEF